MPELHISLLEHKKHLEFKTDSPSRGLKGPSKVSLVQIFNWETQPRATTFSMFRTKNLIFILYHILNSNILPGTLTVALKQTFPSQKSSTFPSLQSCWLEAKASGQSMHFTASESLTSPTTKSNPSIFHIFSELSCNPHWTNKRQSNFFL